jgi:hypothetical protein
MIGGGGRIGKPPGIADVPKPAADAPVGTSSDAKPPVVGDGFEKGAKKAEGGRRGEPGLGKDGATLADVLRLAGEDPRAATKVVDGLRTQLKTTLGEVERELVAARQVVESLAKERFAKAARDQVGRELKKKRDAVGHLKQRYHATLRRAQLVEQLAGCLGDARVSSEIDKLVQQHRRLKTGWGRRFHLLSLGELLFGAAADTPQHLQEVTRAQVLANPYNAATVADELLAQRLITELLARTLDGTTRSAGPERTDAVQGDHGATARSYGLLAELIEASLVDDPLGEDGP